MTETFRILTRDDLKGFRTTPNLESESLKDSLGISFTINPSKVDLDFYNSMVLLRKPFLRRYTGIPLHELLIASSSRSVSLPRADAILVTTKGIPEWRRFAALHENMHTFVGSQNEIFNQLAMPTQSFQENIPQGFNSMVYKILDEGIAQWGAVEASAVLRGCQTPEQRREAHEEFLRRANYSFFYRAGYNFVLRLMDNLQNMGLDTNSALTLMVKNPATEMNQIEQPGVYLKKLISA